MNIFIVDLTTHSNSRYRSVTMVTQYGLLRENRHCKINARACKKIVLAPRNNENPVLLDNN